MTAGDRGRGGRGSSPHFRSLMRGGVQSLFPLEARWQTDEGIDVRSAYHNNSGTLERLLIRHPPMKHVGSKHGRKHRNTPTLFQIISISLKRSTSLRSHSSSVRSCPQGSDSLSLSLSLMLSLRLSGHLRSLYPCANRTLHPTPERDRMEKEGQMDQARTRHTLC